MEYMNPVTGEFVECPDPSFDLVPSGQDFYNDRVAQQIARDKAIAEEWCLSMVLSNAKSEYESAKNTRGLQLRDQGMAVSLISQVLKGDEMVNLRFADYIATEGMLKAIHDFTMARMQDIKLIDEQTKREFGRADG